MNNESGFYENLVEINGASECSEIHSWQGGISRVLLINFLIAFMIATLTYFSGVRLGECDKCTKRTENVSSTTNKGIDIVVKRNGSILDRNDVSSFHLAVNYDDYLRLDSASFKESLVVGHSIQGIKYSAKVRLYEDKIAEIGKWYFNHIEYIHSHGPRGWRRIKDEDFYISSNRKEPDDRVIKRALAIYTVDGIDSELSQLGHCEILKKEW